MQAGQDENEEVDEKGDEGIRDEHAKSEGNM